MIKLVLNDYERGYVALFKKKKILSPLKLKDYTLKL